MRVLIAGGGTGGHLYPGIAVAEVLRQRLADAEVLFVGTRTGIEGRVLPALGYALRTIRARALPRGRSLALFGAFAEIGIGFLQSMILCLRYRPDVVVGTGAYVSAPVLVAAKLFRRPCVVLEQNRIPGRTNRILGRVVDEVHLTFSESRRFFRRKDNLRLTGNPIRPDLLRHDRVDAARRFRLSTDKTTLFVFGGSQGARRINEALIEALPLLSRIRQLQLLVQTGDRDFEWVHGEVSRARVPAFVCRFVRDIGFAYALADLVVCRAGATTIAELTACGLPAILVPYPHAADNHQYWNAEKLVSLGAGERIDDDALTGKRLARTVRRLVMNPARLRRMAMRARVLSRPQAAERVVESIHRLAGGANEEAA